MHAKHSHPEASALSQSLRCAVVLPHCTVLCCAQERHLRLYLRNHAQHAAAREALRGYARAHWHEGLALGCDDGDDDGDDAAEGMGVEEAVRAGSPGSQKVRAHARWACCAVAGDRVPKHIFAY